MVKELDEGTFKEFIGGKEKVLVDFWAPWCGPCIQMAPTLEKYAEEVAPSVEVAKVNVDNNRGLAEEFRVSGIPTFILFSNGKEVKRAVGGMDLDTLKEYFA